MKNTRTNPFKNLGESGTKKYFNGEEITLLSYRPSELISVEIEEAKYASEHHRKLMKMIKDFEETLSDNEEVALMLASFGQSIVLAVEDIGFYNPSQLRFYGKVNGKDSVLIQHVSQLNLLLTSTPKAIPDKPPRRIGFLAEKENDESKDKA